MLLSEDALDCYMLLFMFLDEFLLLLLLFCVSKKAETLLLTQTLLSVVETIYWYNLASYHIDAMTSLDSFTVTPTRVLSSVYVLLLLAT